MAKRLLLQENACEAWKSAIRYCKDILAGKATLYNKKQFVGAFHNSVELFLKQIMINQNDYRVCSFKKRTDKDGMPASAYYKASDIQSYFEKCRVDELGKLFSIEFNEIKDLHTEIINDYLNSVAGLGIKNYTSQLKLLQILRNNETHFYITSSSFLTEKEFIVLHNFLGDFYKILRFYDLLPFDNEEEGTALGYVYNEPVISSFSVKEILKQNIFVSDLKSNTMNKKYFFETIESPSDIAISILKEKSEYENDDFDNIYMYISLLLEYNLIKIKQEKNTKVSCIEYKI